MIQKCHRPQIVLFYSSIRGFSFDEGALTEIGLISSLVSENKDEAWVSPVVQ
jgi:hypothetical protein